VKNHTARLAVALWLIAFASLSHAQTPVLQRGNDPGLSGANLGETTLTTSSVSPSTFGLVATLPVDADVYAQPLYVPNVAVAGQGTHNVVYIASMNDTLYAFDADTGNPLWSVNFATSVGATPVPIANFTFSGNTNIVGNVGILGTPVIDGSTNLMYLVACTLENGTLVYRLHVVDITQGTEPLANVVISGAYGGMTFDGRYQTQRASLTLVGNQVVFGFGPVELEYAGGYSGWVMAYNKQTLVQSGIFATVPTGTKGGGVWQSGRPPAVDGLGNVYVFTGNGYQSGYNGTNAFSESVLKLNPANQLALVDWFTPSNWSALDGQDLDLGSSGPLVVPNTSPALLAGGGKAGTFYLLNTSNLGQFSSTNAGALEVMSAAPQFRGGPVYWQRSVANGGPVLYHWGPNDNVKTYAFNGSTFPATPTQQGTNMPVYPGGILSISANADKPGTGILWATTAASGNLFDDATDPGILYAMDANNVSTVLWSSNGNPTRDALGNFAKFVPPTIANGKVYVATFSNKVAVYGLLATSTAATPGFNPLPGSYPGPQQVTITDGTPGAVIHYTTNGMAPTSTSATYVAGTPLTIASTETVQAIAVASGYNNSAIGGGTYAISAPGTTVSVSLSTAANVVGIGTAGTPVTNGGLDGGGEAYAANLLGTTITWSGSTFTLGVAGAANAASNETLTLPSGTYSSVQLLATAVDGNQTNQTFVVTYTDGTSTSISQSLSDWFTPQNYPGESIASTMPYRLISTGGQDARTFYLYGYSLAVNGAKTVKSITLPKNRNVVVLAIDLIPASGSPPPTQTAATPTLNPGPGAYGGAVQVTLADGTPGAVIHYTTDGTAPGATSPAYVSGTPLSIASTETLQVIAVASGYINSMVTGGTYTITPTAVAPALNPPPGGYVGALQVTLSDTTPGAVIHYTTDGTPPGATSPAYVAGTPLSIASTETLQAIAVASGYNNSMSAGGTYTISAPGTTVSVPLSTAANIVGIGKVGTAVTSGGLDGNGDAYATDLLGTTLTWSGSTFTIGAAGAANAASNEAITLPSGTASAYSRVLLLATAANGNQPSQPFVITYTDGTTTSIAQSLSDWFTPQNYTGESTAVTTAYRLLPKGTKDSRPFYLYGYTLAINNAKTVKSITLPKNRNVVVVAIDLAP
jgi:hypothetical protein